MLQQSRGWGGGCVGWVAEVNKVAEPANLVRRKYLKILLLAENCYQNPRIENTENFCPQNIFCLHWSHIKSSFLQKKHFQNSFILTENFL